MYLSIDGTSDRITAIQWFMGGDGKIEQVEFADGTVWDADMLKSLVVVAEASEGIDELVGTDGNDTINGLGGDDELLGMDGNDTLDGGAGLDYLSGGAGSDVYLFGRGSGEDLILEFDEATDGIDTLRFDSTVEVADVTVTRDLIGTLSLSINGTSDRVQFSNWFADNAGQYKQVERVEFADGTVWDAQALSAMATFLGTSGQDTILGSQDNDMLRGLGGNDTLWGRGGSDVLEGGAGGDSYWMGRGDGADTVHEDDAASGNTDTLQFLDGIASDQIWLRQVANDLEVSIIGTADSVILSNWYLGDQYHIEQFRTNDGKALLDSQVQVLVDAMAAFSPPAAGETTLSAGYQTALQPVIAANWQ